MSIKFYLPFEVLVVMPRVKVLDYGEIDKSKLKLDNCTIPAEIKYDSFGYYKGKLVAIDYG